MTATITVLAEKGSPLSHTEMDNNFRALRNLVEVPTVAALKAMGDGAVPAGSGTVITHGCLASGDGGGGIWAWDVASTVDDNVGTVVKPTGHTGAGRWVRVYDGFLNALWFGVAGDYDTVSGTGTDDSSALQAAINVSAATGAVLFLPNRNYLITDTIIIPEGTNIVGENTTQSSRNREFSRIYFKPTSQKTLFEVPDVAVPPVLSAQLHVGYNISNLIIIGNSASASGNSDYAFNIPVVLYGVFNNLTISKFRTGIRLGQTINNSFRGLYIYDCYVSCVLYAGDEATTDVWEQCAFRTSPIGIDTTNGINSTTFPSSTSASLSIRFIACLFESLADYGVKLLKQTGNWEFAHCYSEAVPATNTTGAMFYVGHDSSDLSVFPNIVITGGQYKGLLVAATRFLDIDYCSFVFLSNVTINIFGHVFYTTANTPAAAIHVSNCQWGFISVSVSNNTGKVQGSYKYGTSKYDELYAAKLQITTYDGNQGIYCGTVGDGSFFTIGADLLLLGYAGKIVAPVQTDTITLGQSIRRWKSVYALDFRPGSVGATIWTCGAGSPEAVITAPIGSLYTRTDGGAGTTLYIKESGTGNTGWVAK